MSYKSNPHRLGKPGMSEQSEPDDQAMCAPELPSKQIPNEFEFLSNAVGALESAYATLRDRLRPVIPQEQICDPKSCGVAGKPEPIMCELASALKSLRVRCRNLETSIERDISSIEL